jgi:hypothetical protein
MDIVIKPYTPDAILLWEQFVEKSWNGTFMHTRRYLSYHQDRFSDCSLLLLGKKGNILGVFPAALNTSQKDMVISHPGISYGGIIHAGELRGNKMLAALEHILEFYRTQGYKKLLYKAIPYIYHRIPAQDDLYALFRINAEPIRTDLACVVDLDDSPPLTQLRKRGKAKAEKAGLEIKLGVENIRPFWNVLEARLQSKFQIQPTHRVEEIELLQSWFPRHIECQAVYDKDHLVAGALLYKTPRVAHAQYIAANDQGYATGALDLLFPVCMKGVFEAGMRYFSFGISTEDEGRILNEGLYNFKSGFGGGGIIHEFFQVHIG